MERFHKTVTARKIAKDVEEDKINLNSIIQRGEVWNNYQKSLLIHSMLSDFPIPALFAQESEDAILDIMDGKQRILAISQFISDNYELHKDTPTNNENIIAGKKFLELTEEEQDKIKDYNILIYYFRNMSEEERDEMFLRLNNGKSLSRIELTRVEAGEEFMEYIRSLARNSFFSSSCNFTASALNKFVDEEVVLHCINMMLYDGAEGLSGKVISNMVKGLKKKGLTDDEKELLEQIIDYLNIAFPEREKFLKKVNIPIVFLLGLQYKDSMLATDFYMRVKEFLADPGELYIEAARVGSAKPENVKTRIDEMDDFLGQFADEKIAV